MESGVTKNFETHFSEDELKILKSSYENGRANAGELRKYLRWCREIRRSSFVLESVIFKAYKTKNFNPIDKKIDVCIKGIWKSHKLDA